MSSVNISGNALVLTKQTASISSAILGSLGAIPGALAEVNAHFRLALGRNQIEALIDPSAGITTCDDVVILSGEVASAYRAFLYGISGNEEALDCILGKEHHAVVLKIWEEIAFS